MTADPAGDLERVRERVRGLLRTPGARLVALTGAGISVGAGLPTYRGSGGLYPAGTLVPLTRSNATKANLPRLWETLDVIRPGGVEPTAAHAALAAAESSGVEVTVVTQNIDGLHHAAGSSRVLELHGNLRRARCLNPRCRAVADVESLHRVDGVPRCLTCASRMRPDVVLFEEKLEAGVFAAAKRAVREAEVFMVVGSSIQVFPAAGLVAEALRGGAVGLWFDTDPAGMLGQVPIEARRAAGRLTPVAGDCQATLPAWLR